MTRQKNSGMPEYKVSGIIAAAGSGSRMGAGINKVFLDICGIPILAHTLMAFENAEAVDDIVVIAGVGEVSLVENMTDKYNITKFKKAVEGGITRQQSVLNGLLASDADIAAVHDGARALITPDIICRCVYDAREHGASAVGVPCVDSLKKSENGFISETIERKNVYNIQTPQVFFRKKLIMCHEKAAEEGIMATDDTALAVRNGIRVFITEGSYENIKITTPSDMLIAGELLKRRGVECV